ncbi:hypothetical protein [Nostoc sp.]|uniref:hypothetical protein n=1 Tax=Nostoc sp. TaxID=1180 RepID=UPI002FF89436
MWNSLLPAIAFTKDTSPWFDYAKPSLSDSERNLNFSSRQGEVQTSPEINYALPETLVEMRNFASLHSFSEMSIWFAIACTQHPKRELRTFVS